MAEKKHTVDLTTGVGTLSFPRLFVSTKGTNDRGEDVYDVQFIIPKSDRDGVRAILRAIKEVGEAKWGDKWRQVRNPLRDGDKEKDELTEDGSTKGEKYPERLGCYFLNAKTSRPVAVVGRDRSPIVNESEIYGGVKAKLALNFYPYATQGNQGIGAGLNGVQKIADGEPLSGSGRPSVESMFDLLDDEDFDDVDDLDLDEEVDEEPPAKKAPAKKTAAKKAPARKKAEPEPEPEEDDEDDLYDLDDDI